MSPYISLKIKKRHYEHVFSNVVVAAVVSTAFIRTAVLSTVVV
jgi:hypothetical protein